AKAVHSLKFIRRPQQMQCRHVAEAESHIKWQWPGSIIKLSAHSQIKCAAISLKSLKSHSHS
ncbi:hypothetical protein, partial [Mesorhizobium sp. M00.F.Ca.ET.216.01.1.1]|uniref:hypothetical protein n=1 Tax=Mesorhizobium sp. M00.F.Ca.ET.216.01.1.1 TaxID=2500528 RepID=UPI001AEDB752